MRFARNATGAGPRIPTRLVSDPSTVRHVRATSCAPSSVPPRARLAPRDASFAVSEARTRAPPSACRDSRVGWVQVEPGPNPFHHGDGGSMTNAKRTSNAGKGKGFVVDQGGKLVGECRMDVEIQWHTHETRTVHPPPVQTRARGPGGMDPHRRDRRIEGDTVCGGGSRFVRTRRGRSRTTRTEKNGTNAPIPIALDTPLVNGWRANTCMSSEEERCGPCGLLPSARAPLLAHERLEGGPSPGYLSSDGS